MKSRILQSVAPILLVISFAPALCRAQAEIDPDHFDAVSDISKAENKATSNQTSSQAYGSFFLPFEVKCAGVKLAPGHYSVSVRQAGRRDVVTLMRTVNGVRAQALVVKATPRWSHEAPTGLVVDHTNQQRTLTAISLRQPGATLYLQIGKEAGTSMDAELIPISYPASRATAASGN